MLVINWSEFLKSEAYINILKTQWVTSLSEHITLTPVSLKKIKRVGDVLSQYNFLMGIWQHAAEQNLLNYMNQQY